MTTPTECPCGRPRAGCEYHDTALQASDPAEAPKPKLSFAELRQRVANSPSRAGLRLLGPDDPEVSSDLIYLDEATGGVVAVPQGPAVNAPTPSMAIGGLPIPYDEYVDVRYPRPEMPGRFAITLLRNSEREVKVNAMFLADKLGTHRVAFVAIDSPELRTDHAWFEARNVGVRAVTYVLRFVS